MAIFTVTSGSFSELGVVKVSPVVDDCFTLYEYIINTNPGDDIDITLSGNHFKARYIANGVETAFNDTANVTFSTSLRVRFLLINSGVTSVFPSATIRIDNNTTGFFYENFVERDNDGANCYESDTIPTKTSDLLNDGDDGINPFLDSADLSGYLPLTGGTITGDLFFQNGANLDLNMQNNQILGATTVSTNSIGVIQLNGGTTVNFSSNPSFMSTGGAGFSMEPAGDSTNSLNYGGGVWRIGQNPIVSGSVNDTASSITFAPYLSITSTDVQAALQELKDEVDLLGATTIDSSITDGSTNPVENNAIFDEFQLVAYVGNSNVFSGSSNTFTQEVIIHDDVDGLEIFNTGSENAIDLNASDLHLYGNSNPAGGWRFQPDSGLIGTSSAYIYSPYIEIDSVPYSAGWAGSDRVANRGAIYDKIESLVLGGGNVNISGTPADNQIAVWTNADTIEGTTGLTYDGSNLQLTGDVGSTGSRITKGWFTDLEVSNAIVADITGESATVTSIGNLTGDVTSVNRVTTIAAGAVDIPMLSAGGSPSATTFLRGDNTWATPAGSGDVSKVGTPINNEIGVWTGDGTIEGDANLQWNGTQLNVTGDVNSSGSLYAGTGQFCYNNGNRPTWDNITLPYVEDTFVPGLVGGASGTYTTGTAAGNYIRIGKIVNFTIFLSGIVGSAPLGVLTVTNLPGACNTACVCSVEMTGGDVSFYSVHGIVQNNGSGGTIIQIKYQQLLDTNNTTTMQNVNFSSGIMRITGTYLIL